MVQHTPVSGFADYEICQNNGEMREQGRGSISNFWGKTSTEIHHGDRTMFH